MTSSGVIIMSYFFKFIGGIQIYFKVHLTDFFENHPNEICSYLSEKASKGMFLKPIKKLQNHSNEGKRKEKKKERGVGKKEKRKKNNGCTLSFYNGYFGRKKKMLDAKGPFGDNVIKNTAKYIRRKILKKFDKINKLASI